MLLAMLIGCLLKGKVNYFAVCKKGSNLRVKKLDYSLLLCAVRNASRNFPKCAGVGPRVRHRFEIKNNVLKQPEQIDLFLMSDKHPKKLEI